MVAIAYALIILGGLGMATFLVMHSHPVWAGLFLLLLAGVEITRETKE